MRKYFKEQCLEVIQTLKDAKGEIKELVLSGDTEAAKSLLADCQQSALELGAIIENEEGEGTEAVSALENYCEEVYQYYNSLSDAIGNDRNISAEKQRKRFVRLLMDIGGYIRNEIPTSIEIVFFPYNASMWDSLESIYMAAKENPLCDPYVIPIPYFDKNPDGSFKAEHYEGDMFPEDIPIVHYNSYNLEERHPEVVFIHNPYDQYNYVTSVHPAYYSERLKQFTDCLIYVPYYTTAGAMSESQSLLSAYIHADYTILQSEQFLDYIDDIIPREKLLPLGSPKFDSIIKKCASSLEAPEEWREMLQGRTVYFYNTSISGFLDNTRVFLQKMEYVFRTFAGRKDVCLLWRPHPLLESTIDSMRPYARPIYNALKQFFLDEKIGILDTTPQIEPTIALSDVYIGDSGTSVTALFGIVGKPIYLLNNYILQSPGDNDWKSIVFALPDWAHNDRYCVAQGNNLYRRNDTKGKYYYYRSLSSYVRGNYYDKAYEFSGKLYVFPRNAEHILVIEEDGNRIIPLQHEIECGGAFALAVYKPENERYVFLIPNQYPHLVRFDTQTECIDYVEGVGAFGATTTDSGERVVCPNWFYKDNLCFINPPGTEVLEVDVNTLKKNVRKVSVGRVTSCLAINKNNDGDIWFLPYQGTIITRWLVEKDIFCDYNAYVEGLQAYRRPREELCDTRYFSSAVFYDGRMILAPERGNAFVSLDIENGRAERWKSPFDTYEGEESGYWTSGAVAAFIADADTYYGKSNNPYRIFFFPERKSYEIDLETGALQEISMEFDRDDAFAHAAGFDQDSQWMPYCCVEDAFNSLEDFLSDTIHGKPFDKKKALEAFRVLNASPDGDCGKKVLERILLDLKIGLGKDVSNQ